MQLSLLEPVVDRATFDRGIALCREALERARPSTYPLPEYAMNGAR